MSALDSTPRSGPRAWLSRDLCLLFAGWAFSSTGSSMVVTVSVLCGYLLAPDKSLATLPVAVQWIATAAATIPASLIMARIGRRNGFLIGNLIGAVGAAIAATAMVREDFVLLNIGIALVGAQVGFNWYFRFAAAEVVPDEYRSKGIATVLAGGIVGAFAGPGLALYSRNLWPDHTFAGTFAVLLAVIAASSVVLIWLRIPRPRDEDLRGGRPLMAIVRQPIYLTALAGAVVAYATMVLLMSVTPLAMKLYGLPFEDTTWVIQWHILGMYIPAFFSGHLISRFGEEPMMFVGGCIVLLCVGVLLAGESAWHFLIAMVLLGLGWNFLFVGATTLLTRSYTVAERAKAQAFNEVCVFGGVACGVLFSGALLTKIGWHAVNFGALPLVVLITLASLWLTVRRGRHPRDAAPA